MALESSPDGLSAALRRHHLPKQGMIDMPAHIIAQTGTNRFRGLAQTLEQVLRRKLGQLGLVGKELVGIVHIGLVMLVVMNLHGECVDVRLQRFIGIRKRRQSVGTSRRRSAGRLSQSGHSGPPNHSAARELMPRRKASRRV